MSQWATSLTPRQIELLIKSASERDTGEDAVIATDPAGTILYWNARAQALYGWRSDQVLGRNIVEVTPTQQTSNHAEEIMDQLRRGQPWSGAFIVRQRDGKPLMAHVTDVPIEDEDTIIGVVGISRRDGESSRG